MLDPLSAPATRNAIIALVLAFLFIYIVPLGVRPLKRPDEVRYAAVPQEMLASGDMVVPRLNGMRYFEKPVFSYWMTATSIQLLGENEFAVRLPVALASGVAIAATAWLAASFAGALAGLIAAAVLLSALAFYAVGTHLVVDMPFSSALALVFVFFFVGDRARSRGARYGALGLFGVFSAIACLIKGPLGLLLPGMTVIGYLLWERRLRELPALVWLPLLTFAATALPWSLLVHSRDGGFWHYFIMVEHVHRFASSEAQHGEPFWFFVPVFVGAALPWTIALPTMSLGVRRVWRDGDERRRLIRYCLCAFALPFVFFSLSRGKLPTYLLPLFPAFAILVGIGLPRALDGRPGRWFRLLSRVFAVIVAALGVGLLAATGLENKGEPIYERGEVWKAAIGAAGLWIWAIALLQSARSTNIKRAIAWFAVGPWLVLALSPWLIPNIVTRAVAPQAFLEKYAARIDDRTAIVADATLMHAVLWYYQRDDAYVIGGTGEFTYGLSFADQAHRHINGKALAKALEGELAGKHVVVIARTRHLDLWYKRFPPPDFEVREGRYSWVEYDLRGR